MSTKICTSCQLDKPLTEFRFRNKQKGLYHYRCKSCCSTTEKQKWHQNSEFRAKRGHERQIRVQRNKDFFNAYMNDKSCEKCGNSDRRVLEFHHIDPTEKKSMISDMWQTTYSIETIKTEIAKCQILCANCHKIETYEQFGWQCK